MKIGKKVLNQSRMHNDILRNMCGGKELTRDQLIQPLFFHEHESADVLIEGLGENRILHDNNIIDSIAKDMKNGCRNFILFFVPRLKTNNSFNTKFCENILKKIKIEFQSDIQVWVDLCICSFTKTGHCCLFKQNKIDLENSLNVMSNFALSFANGGADGIAPSSMLFGVVKSIRQSLDKNNFNHVPIMSYSTKFASNFYGPFRAAADSTPAFGDRTGYQLDYNDYEKAIQSSITFSEEGADLMMVKPGLLSLDLIKPINEKTSKPVGAYQVSGEYSSLVYLAEKKLIDFDKGLLETWSSLKRGGAQYIISYGARYAKRLGI